MKCHGCSKQFLGGGIILEHNDGSTIDYCSQYCLEKKFKGYAVGCIQDADSCIPKNPLGKRYNDTRKIFFRACLRETPTEQLKKLKASVDDAMTNMLEVLNEEVQSGIETEQEYLYTADFLRKRSLFTNLIIQILGK